VHVGLNKGEAKNALAKAVFFNRLGEMRDRSFENQRYRSRSRSLNIAGHPKRVVQMIVPEVQLEEWPPDTSSPATLPKRVRYRMVPGFDQL
jgi:hypothetical protein